MTDQTGRPGPAAPTPPLVGRERELGLLRDALDAALAGHGSLVLISGEAGIGKTTLAEALCREAAERGAAVLVGRCYDLCETPPYGPWCEVFARAPRDAGLPALPTAVLLPDGGGDAVTGQDAIARRILAYLAAVAARQPLVLLLDDLHWADPASLDLLRVLARQLADTPILLPTTYRADEIAHDHPLAALLPALVRESRAERIDLRPLDEAAIDALVAARYALGDRDRGRVVGYLAGRTEGNALFLGELLRTLESAGSLCREDNRWVLGDLERVPVPTLLRQVIAGRLARLGDEDRRLLAVAAVIGQEPPFDLWAAVGKAEDDALLATIERVIAVRALEATEVGVRFAHALIREALYDGTLAPRRRAWHRLAGEALLATTAPDPDAVAYHLRQADDPRAAEWLERAGERAQRAYAWLTAAARFEAALALVEAQGADAGRRGWLTYWLASLRRFADAPRALADAEAAVRLADAAGDPLLAALGTFLAGGLRCSPAIRDRRRGIPLMEAGLAALAALPEAARMPPGATAPLDPAPLWNAVILDLGRSGRYAEALARGERYLAEMALPATADWAGNTSHADVLHGLGHVYAGLGRPDRARAALARARELLHAVGHHHMAAGAAWDEALVVEWYAPDRPDELARLLAGVREASGRAAGVDEGQGRRRPWDVPRLLREGRWAELGALAPALVDSPADVYVPELGRFDRAQGRPEAAWARVRRILPDGPATAPGDPDLLFALPLQRLAADLALDAGDLPAARTWLAAHDRWLAWSGAVLGQSEGQLGWAAYHRAAGDPVLARAHAEAALAHATEPRQPLALLAAHRTLGELDTAAGRHACARDNLDTALALADACAAPYERALTLLALAELPHAEGCRDGAAAPLEEAKAICARLEARPDMARIAALAARLAATPPAPSRPDGLSRREAEVLRLLAAGRSNHQIAQALFVSPRTVKRHIANAYLKVGTHNRSEATAYALRHQLA